MASAGLLAEGKPSKTVIQAGLAKLVNPGGLNALLRRGKEIFGRTQAWQELLSCDVVYGITTHHWLGLKGDDFWELKLVNDVPLYRNVPNPKLTEEEMAVMRTAQSRLTAGRNATVLANRLSTRNAEMAEKVKDLQTELGKTLALLGREKIKNSALELENRKLLLERGAMEERIKALETRHSWKGLRSMALWLFVAILLGGYMAGTDAECTLVDVPYPIEISYQTFLEMCAGRDSYLPTDAYNRTALTLACAENMDYMDCKNYIDSMIKEKLHVTTALKKILYVEEIFAAIEGSWTFVKNFGLAMPLCTFVMLCLTRDRKNMVATVFLLALSWLLRISFFSFSLLAVYAPLETTTAGVLAATEILPTPVLCFFHWCLLVLKAVFVPTEAYILQRISTSLCWSTVLPIWCLGQELVKLVAIPVEFQILVFILMASVTAGFNYMNVTVQVTEPDGTIKKHKRFAAARTAVQAITSLVFEKAKAIRGIIPAFPSKTECVVKIEAGDSLGVGFRLGNYIYTAGHVVGEEKTLKMTWKGLTTSAKVLGHIELPLFTDTIVKIEVPKPFQLLPVMRLAKEAANDYLQMTSFSHDFNNIVSFTGWAVVDGAYINAPFETYPGTSGSPLTNRDGRLVGMHFGSNAVVSQGYALVSLFSTEPTVKQSTGDDDELLRRVMDGVRTSHAAILKKLEEQDEKIKTLQQQLEVCLSRDTLSDEKKKGKTKKTARGMKHRAKGISKAAFMRQKILTEEEYKRLEEEGFTKEEIHEIVNNLREQAWIDYQNDLDEEDDWYDDMCEDDRINDEIARKIDEDLEDRGEWYPQGTRITYKEKAMLKLIKGMRDASKNTSVTINFPDNQEEEAEKLFDKIVTTEDVPVDELTEAYLTTPNQVRYVTGKVLNMKHAKIKPEVTFVKSGVTQISGTDGEQTILKSKTTTRVEEKDEEKPADEKPQYPPVEQEPLEQQKKKGGKVGGKKNKMKPLPKAKCVECGETYEQRSIYHECKSKNLGEPPTGGTEPVPDYLKWNAWPQYLEPLKLRITVPENYPILGHISLDKLVERKKRVNDPLLKMLKPPDVEGFTSTTWTRKAYTKSFEKFDYGVACDFINDYPEHSAFADACLLAECGYMEGSRVIPIQETQKNMESTPAFPKMLDFDTEKDYLEKHGLAEYVEIQTSSETIKHKPLWWCFLKNEILKEKKVADDDIRIISCSDPVFTRLGAAIDSMQNARMKERTETHHAQVGWTPFFGGLDRRIRRITSNGRTKILELDWTRFDGTIPVQLFQRVREIRKFFLSKTSRKKYKNLIDWYNNNLTDRVTLLPTGEVTHIKKGNPSGQFSTTVDNNMVNEWLTAFEFCWLYESTHGRIPTVEEYRANVDFLCYGDDRLLAYNPSFVLYNTEEVIRMYKDVFGMWVKPENIKLFDSPTGSSFCGFTFVKPHGKWVGVVNTNKLLTSLRTPVRRLPDIESLWGKLVSLKIMCYHSDPDAVSYLSEQIKRVEDYAKAEGVQLPEVGPDFYRRLW
uniref:Non-structural polyprotein 1AB n=1 Tax=Avastrovirus 2 TaxID=1239438 RepID=A0A3G1RP54_9VIRU|nr:MAG: non-structural polyprotein [Avastrovirus 2]